MSYSKFLANVHFLKILFSYDRVESAEHFSENVKIYSELNNANICDLLHRETPATNKKSIDTLSLKSKESSSSSTEQTHHETNESII